MDDIAKAITYYVQFRVDWDNELYDFATLVHQSKYASDEKVSFQSLGHK